MSNQQLYKICRGEFTE